MRLKQRSNVDFPQPEGPMNEVICLVADLDIHVLERMVVAIEQVEALNIDSRRRGGKILCRGASRIPNLALVRGLGLRFHEFFKLRGLHSRSSPSYRIPPHRYQFSSIDSRNRGSYARERIVKCL